jgi:hypothetical protein
MEQFTRLIDSDGKIQIVESLYPRVISGIPKTGSQDSNYCTL